MVSVKVVLFPLHFNFVMHGILGQALKNSAANFSVTHDKTLFDLEYADDIVCTCEPFTDGQLLLDSLICSAARCGLKFAHVMCKTILFNCLLTFYGRYLTVVASAA